jgi:hypothetical protein
MLSSIVGWGIEGGSYQFASGDVGDLLSLGVLGGLITGLVRHWRRHECHVQKCHRVIWKTVPGTDHEVCKHHHPHDEPSHAEVIEAHRLAVLRKSK